MTTLAEEVEEVIERYQGQDNLEQYQDMQTTDLLKKGPEEELDGLQPRMAHGNLDQIYQDNDLADALEEAYKLGEEWERRATNYLLQRAAVEGVANMKLE